MVYNHFRSEKSKALLKLWGKKIDEIGHIRVRKIRYKKSNTFDYSSSFYAYFIGFKGKEEYLGPCDSKGFPRNKNKIKKQNK